MAKFLVTNGSYFQPFTYDELSKPIVQTVEAHNAAQEAYDTLTTETEALRQYLLREPEDSEARRLYDNYTIRLQTLQNNLWKSGYNASTRRDLSLARAGYASDITRLGTAIKARQDLSNEYWKTKHEHPDMVMASDPGLSPLDKFLDNDRYGKDYYSYSGAAFMNEVALDAKARVNEMLNDPEILDKYPQLVGYIPILKKNGFSSMQVEAAALAVRAAYNGDTSLLERLDPASAILASVLSSNLNSTGAFGKVSASEFDRLIDYGRKGLSQAIGSTDVQFLHDLAWAEQQKVKRENERFQHNMTVAALQAGQLGNEEPVSAELRGNQLDGFAAGERKGELGDKQKVLNALTVLNDLKKEKALKDDKGKVVDAAKDALDVLRKSDYFKTLSGGKDHYITTTDLDPVIQSLAQDIDSSLTNDHLYQFHVTEGAAENMARTYFKPNIGQLSGKDGDSIAAEMARYSGDKEVKAKDLMALLMSKNLLVGIDGETGWITVQRNAADNAEDVGNYDDRVVYLNPQYVLQGGSAYANSYALRYAIDQTIKSPKISSQDTVDYLRDLSKRIAASTTIGDTIDLRVLSSIIRDSYVPLVKEGNDNTRIIYNSLISAFGDGLFDTSNTQYKPNQYTIGWSSKTGGPSLPDFSGASSAMDIFYDEGADNE